MTAPTQKRFGRTPHIDHVGVQTYYREHSNHITKCRLEIDRLLNEIEDTKKKMSREAMGKIFKASKNSISRIVHQETA